MRAFIFTPSTLLLFAVLNLLIGVDFGSTIIIAGAAIGAVACLVMLLRRRFLRRRAMRAGTTLWQERPAPRGRFYALRVVGIVLVAAYAEWVVLHVALDPWSDPPPGPVRGEIRLSGPDFGKGVNWSPDLCLPATNPGVTAAALRGREAPFPLAWVIARAPDGIAAIDVQRSLGAETIRFFPADCTRLHGDVQPVRDAAGTGRLTGYADAECVHGGDTLTMHVDFTACPPAPAPAPTPAPSGTAASVR